MHQTYSKLEIDTLLMGLLMAAMPQIKWLQFKWYFKFRDVNSVFNVDRREMEIYLVVLVNRTANARCATALRAIRRSFLMREEVTKKVQVATVHADIDYADQYREYGSLFCHCLQV